MTDFFEGVWAYLGSDFDRPPLTALLIGGVLGIVGFWAYFRLLRARPRWLGGIIPVLVAAMFTSMVATEPASRSPGAIIGYVASLLALFGGWWLAGDSDADTATPEDPPVAE